MVRRDKVIQEIFVGSIWELTEDIFGSHVCRFKFTCMLYRSITTTTENVIELRYQVFCVKKGDLESNKLLPCADCLKKHCQRENYHRKFGA